MFLNLFNKISWI